MKRIDDAPHRAAQPHERRHRRRNRQPWHIPFKPRDFFRCPNLHPALDRHQIPNRARGHGLPLVLLIPAFEHADQRARPELLRPGAARAPPPPPPRRPPPRRSKLHLVRMMDQEIRLNASSTSKTSLATAPVLEIMSTISPPTNTTSKGKNCIAFKRTPAPIIEESRCAVSLRTPSANEIFGCRRSLQWLALGSLLLNANCTAIESRYGESSGVKCRSFTWIST